MLQIVCLNAGDYCSHGKRYVETLFDMVTRNISDKTSFKFVCFTDDAEEYAAGIEKRPLEGTLNGWFNKLYLFKEGLFPDGDRIVYFDLDTCIVNGLDEIIKYDGDFAILRDVNRPVGFQSSIMLWKASSSVLNIWDQWNIDRPLYIGGDQEAIEKARHLLDNDILQDIFPGCFYSYKQSCQFDIPKGAKIVFFHGLPRPHEVLGTWVEHIWRVGGGSIIEYEIVGNVTDAEVTDNVKHALTLPHQVIDDLWEPDDIELCIVGGGPSLADCLDDIRARYEDGAVIWALNNSFKYLIANNIFPHAQIMLDARAKNAEFVPASTKASLIYAASCHADVFKAAEASGGKILIWYPLIAGIKELVGDKAAAFIGCGNSVGLKAMGLAYVLGFKNVHIYGYDSSYRNDQNHAYAQPMNDGERIIEVEVNGRKFKTAPWMAMQADEFKATLQKLIEEHQMEFTIHGDGLLPYVASLLHCPDPSESLDIMEKDGVWWPVNDIECYNAMQSSMADIAKIMEFVDGRDTVIQAGGNVGMWPIELAKHFAKIHTFEPDALNYMCLERNCADIANITMHNAALGEKPGSIELARKSYNCGAHYVSGEGSIPVMLIDDLELDSCDLIQLDIEGYEYNALLGAEKTIAKYGPVIVVEEKGLGDKYGAPDGTVAAWLKPYGYELVLAVARDLVFVKKSKSAYSQAMD